MFCRVEFRRGEPAGRGVRPGCLSLDTSSAKPTTRLEQPVIGDLGPGDVAVGEQMLQGADAVLPNGTARRHPWVATILVRWCWHAQFVERHDLQLLG